VVFSAITNGPKGLVPVKAANGSAPRSNQFQISGTGSDDFYRGQPLDLSTAGLLVKLTNAGTPIVGVFSGVEYVATDGSVIFKPFWDSPGAVQTGSQVRATIYDDPLTIFQIRADATLSIDEVGGFYDFDTAAGTGGSTVTGQSSISLSVSSENDDPDGRSVLLRQFDVQKGRPGDLRTALVQIVLPVFGAALSGEPN
jgi:hypothetical protein